METLDADQIKSLFENGVMPEPNVVVDNGEIPVVTGGENTNAASDSDVKVNINSKPEEENETEPDSYEESKEKANKREDDDNDSTSPIDDVKKPE